MGFQKKNELRKHFLALRKALPLKRRCEAEQGLFELLTQEVRDVTWIASFISFRGEIEMSHINSWILHQKKLVLPRIDIKPLFACVERETDIERHHLGFFQPQKKCKQPKTLDCILVPGLAFDEHNYRIGYGRGDYDALLKEWPDAYTIGIGFREQKTCSLPIEAHDIPLDTVYLF